MKNIFKQTVLIALLLPVSTSSLFASKPVATSPAKATAIAAVALLATGAVIYGLHKAYQYFTLKPKDSKAYASPYSVHLYNPATDKHKLLNFCQTKKLYDQLTNSKNKCTVYIIESNGAIKGIVWLTNDVPTDGPEKLSGKTISFKINEKLLDDPILEKLITQIIDEQTPHDEQFILWHNPNSNFQYGALLTKMGFGFDSIVTDHYYKCSNISNNEFHDMLCELITDSLLIKKLGQ